MSVPSPRPRLIALQRLYIRLLYCETTAREYAATPDDVLGRYGLRHEDRASLPHTTSARHLAEMHGRRLLCARELANALPETIALLAGENCSAREIADAAWFRAFLSSDSFYSPDRSLPDAWGMGRGYEGVSRFFFWIRDRSDALAGGAPLRETLFREFSVWLVRSAADATHAAWSKLARGSYWQAPGDAVDRFTVISSAGTVIELTGDHSCQQLQELGLVDLALLTPETIE